MKIALDCTMLGKTGIGTYLEGVLDYLPEEHSYLLIGDIKLLEHKKKPNRTLLHFKAPMYSIKQLLGYPLKEVHACDAFYSPHYNIPLGLKIPVFFTLHDVIFFEKNSGWHPIKAFIAQKWTQYSFKKAKKVFTVSEFSKQRITYFLKNPSKILITYNGLSSDFLKVPLNAKPKKGWVYIGNIKHHKGLDVLLKSLQMLRMEGNTESLYLIGNYKNLGQKDTTVLQDLNSIENIIQTGYLKTDELYTLIQGARALILPSRYEGFGIPPLEALYLETPAIISDIAVLKEIYQDFPVSFFNINEPEDLKNLMIKESPLIKREDIVQLTKDKNYTYKSISSFIIQQIQS